MTDIDPTKPTDPALRGISPTLSCLAVAALMALTSPVHAQQPLSASDWLSGSVRGPVRESSAWRPTPRPPSDSNSSPVAATGSVSPVLVSRLADVDLDAAGIVTARKAGLPTGLWAGSDPTELAALVLSTPARLPAMSNLLTRILTAQLTPPTVTNAQQRGQLFLARADRLLDMGAVEPAGRLLLSAAPGDPEVFRRLFDIALLTGEESRACLKMDDTPGVAPSFSARIYCLAQTGDWAAAAISLRGAETLGLLDAQQGLLLTHFLDDAFVDSGEHLAPSDRMTPLEFRVHEAIGQPLPTGNLPIAFAHSDLRLNNGWKARIEAAERLARANAIPATTLRQIYAEQKPAASGGVWERAGAMRTLEAAIASGDPLSALPRAFEEFRRNDMTHVLAAMVAADLPGDVQGEAGQIAGWLRQWQGLPVRDPVEIPSDLRSGPLPAPSDRAAEALLSAMTDIDAGMDGAVTRAARGLATLRALGLREDADLAAAQLALLQQFRDAAQ
ncbi:hypothetical protein PAF17_11170 [Paracoccus sp. Z330]|uniref:Antifreeze glycopeptide n=1 Tax=Paracoccus onchidii TaxID=3017813 RepID=A0ABT4ZFJ1_9RHOB|nr:hypothetical protein [Paracoccus onchidii]MDB6178062.1 hypothetical protein [Paracoccus onchidii]